MPDTSATGVPNNPPPGAQLNATTGLFTCPISDASKWQTYDVFVTATDSARRTDQYELVIYTNVFNRGYSIAAGSGWQSMNENMVGADDSATVSFPRSPDGMFSYVKLVLDQLPVDGTLYCGGEPAVTGLPSPPPSFNTCRTRPSVGSTRSAPLLLHRVAERQLGPDGWPLQQQCCDRRDPGRAVGADHRCRYLQRLAVLQPRAGQQRGAGVGCDAPTDHATFNIDANNPREDGVPSDLQFTIDFTGIRVFDNGVEINSGDVFSMMVSSTASTSYIALQVWPIPGAGSATLTAYRSVWSCQARQTGLSDGWFAGVDSALKITIVSAILHGVDYHSNNYDQATGVNKSFHMVEHDPAPAGSYGRWEWWDAQDNGSATNDSDDHDWPVCYTTLGGPDGIVEVKTEVQIVVSAVPADSTGIVVTGEGDIGDPSNGFTTIKMTQVSPPVYYPDPALKGYLVDVWLQAQSGVPTTILDTKVDISWWISFYKGARRRFTPAIR